MVKSGKNHEQLRICLQIKVLTPAINSSLRCSQNMELSTSYVGAVTCVGQLDGLEGFESYFVNAVVGYHPVLPGPAHTGGMEFLSPRFPWVI